MMCPECQGWGHVSGSGPHLPCPQCEGAGELCDLCRVKSPAHAGLCSACWLRNNLPLGGRVMDHEITKTITCKGPPRLTCWQRLIWDDD
jgi:hypothetical protein